MLSEGAAFKLADDLERGAFFSGGRESTITHRKALNIRNVLWGHSPTFDVSDYDG